ncbi:MAG: hypothetical protein IT453_10860 [Planctomycetes bacterium]|nr:hypothetical protein [Planctomycetota bacterium]
MRRPQLLRSSSASTLLLLAACATGGGEQRSSVRDLVAHGQHGEALRLAEQRARELPDDASAQADYKLASVAVLLERCRRACFEDRDEEALAFALQARELAPGDRVVEGWHQKMLFKLADRSRAQAIEAHASDNLELAKEKYEEALRYDPNDRRAKNGVAQALLQINFRAGMGEAYYREGTQAMTTYFLHEARSLFTYTMKYTPKNARASDRKGEVSTMIAEDRAAIAADLEARGLYAAAENEYRIALLIEPTLEPAIAGRERTGREAAVAKVLDEADRLTLKRRFSEARALLETQRGSTDIQTERFDAALAAIEEAELESMYQDALTFESDGRYPEAVEAFGKLLGRVQFYKDALTRKENVEGYIQRAAETYEKALASPSTDEQIRLLRGIELYWPDYKDVRERLKALGAPKP